MLTRLATLGLSLLFAGALSAATDALEFESPGHPAAIASIGNGELVMVLPIAATRSAAGESLDSFAMRVAPWFRNFTASSGFEACGRFGRSAAGQFSIVITTSNAQVGCANGNLFLDGFEDTGETIHSHPQVRRFVAEGNDRAFLRATIRGSRPVPLRQRLNGGGLTFSESDFESGPGYLVTASKVLHQRGKGTVREVGELPAVEVGQ